MKLDAAIETFLHERENLNPDSARRWRIEPDLFKEQSGKVYLSELTREDVFAYRKWYKDHGRSENTIALRTSSLFTFGARFNVLFNLLKNHLLLPAQKSIDRRISHQIYIFARGSGLACSQPLATLATCAATL